MSENSLRAGVKARVESGRNEWLTQIQVANAVSKGNKEKVRLLLSVCRSIPQRLSE